MRRSFVPVLGLTTLLVACGDAAHRPIPSGPREPLLPTPAAAAPTPTHAADQPARAEEGGRSPLQITAAAVEGHPPLPTYRAKVRNVSGRPVRRVIATVVYLDAKGRALPGENQDVAFGSPLKPIDPGVTLETSFLSRVDRAPALRLVVRVVTFLEKGPGPEPVPREWMNPRYEADLAEAEGR